MYNDGNGVTPTLRAWGLTKTFGVGDVMTTALRDVSIELYPGQLSLLMGPSGSGKSTLLAALSGLLRPDSGRVLCLDHDIWSMSEKQREHFRLKHCGFIFQGYNLFPALTARQQLEMVLRWSGISGWREARQRTDAILDLLGLAKKANLRPNQLSGGEKQRVAIGRALIKEPSFCFADEPTAALDWKHGEQVIELLRAAAHDGGATILVVAHDSRLIPHVDRVFHLEDGVLVEGIERPLSLVAGDTAVAAEY
ncbi:MAG: ABC transporter ATP-binding protein [Gemmataceae bacterium]|nr:ABC transporter ATP-binding protein [Gemmataceae bacterium]MCI0743434.1 ABC transporter ATP-binding protein [Gemmataceae bacterium]